MNDLLFLQNLAKRGRVALLASAEEGVPIAVPSPTSVMDDTQRAGRAFVIPLLSPEDIRSGDGRTFEAGTIEHRDLPLPLLWQPELDDGHKTGVIVGRMDSMEITPQGWGNVKGVFDNGPWGREAERLVDGGFLRFVSADYDNFEASVLEPNEGDESVIKDDEIRVGKSRIIAATLVAKPAFQECTIHIADDLPVPDGEYSEEPALAASLSYDPALFEQVQDRLARLEAIYETRSANDRALRASAARSRVDAIRADRLAAQVAALTQRIGRQTGDQS